MCILVEENDAIFFIRTMLSNQSQIILIFFLIKVVLKV